jgi:1,4-dihydroxy-6-naphthoate synthase
VPLGLDVVRRDLGPELMRAVSAGFRASIEAARDHEDDALRYALAFGRGLDRDRGRRFVRMYVNDHTLDMGDLGRRALDTLYRRAVAVGALTAPPPLEIV